MAYKVGSLCYLNSDYVEVNNVRRDLTKENVWGQTLVHLAFGRKKSLYVK